MDEPCSALDPIATRRIEELMLELKEKYTIAIVTHNMQQAKRVADTTAFFYVDISQGGRTGYLVEMGPTKADLREPARAAHQGLYPRRVQLSCTGESSDETRIAHRRAALLLVAGVPRRRCGHLGAAAGGTARWRCGAPAAPSRRRSTSVDRGLPAGPPGDRASAYDAVGSGEGIKRFTAGSVDFGASDAAMSDARSRQGRQRACVSIPATAGMVVLAYNLPGSTAR